MHRTSLFVSLFFLSACTVVAPATHTSEDTPQRPAASSSLTTTAGSSSSAKIGASYRNDRFGFSLQLPESLTSPGSCTLTTEPPEGYRVAAFEDGSSIYLAPNIYGELMAKIPNDTSAGSDCVRINNTLQTILKKMTGPLVYPYGWRMIADEHVDNDDRLLAFVREWYGPTCTLGMRTSTGHEGTVDVAIGNCMGDIAYALKYSPSTSTVVTWRMSPDNLFDGQGGAMADSFRFE